MTQHFFKNSIESKVFYRNTLITLFTCSNLFISHLFQTGHLSKTKKLKQIIQGRIHFHCIINGPMNLLEQYPTSLETSSASVHSGCSSLWRLIALALAPSNATSVASLAVPWMTPPPLPPEQARNSAGRSNILPSQSIITTSSSVHAGLAICNIKRALILTLFDGGAFPSAYERY